MQKINSTGPASTRSSSVILSHRRGSSTAFTPTRAKLSREEPDAGNLHVRVCEGWGWQHPHLLGSGAARPGSVYERDPSAKSPAAGYRLSVSPSGARASKPACRRRLLPADARDRRAQPGRNISRPPPEPPGWRRSSRARPEFARQRRPVARTTLRRILLEGLDGAVSFGKTFVSFEDESDGRICARFSDGSKPTRTSSSASTAPIRRSVPSSCPKPGGSRRGSSPSEESAC